MVKRPFNTRLSEEAISITKTLSARKGVSATAIIEMAVREMGQKEGIVVETLRSFTWTPVNEDDLTSTDLSNAAWYGTPEGIQDETDIVPHVVMMAGHVTVDGEPNAVEFVVLYLEREQSTRIGIAWGGDATWGDFRCTEGNDTPAFSAELNACLNEYLNDWDAWESRN